MQSLNFLRVFVKSYALWMTFWLSSLTIGMVILLAMNVAPFAVARWVSGNAGNPFTAATEEKILENNPFEIPPGEDFET